MKDEWRMKKDEWKIKKDEGWMMKDDDFKLLRGFGDGRTNEQTFVIVESLSRLKKFVNAIKSYSKFTIFELLHNETAP